MSDRLREFDRTSEAAGIVDQIMKTLARGEEVAIKATDSRMEPSIQKGDMMVFVTASMDRVKPGNIILCRFGGAVDVRRVIRKAFIDREICLLVKSDCKKELDPPLRPGGVSAVLKAVERRGKSIPAWRLKGSILDRLTDYGSASPFVKVLGGLFFFLPKSLRPGAARRKK